MCCWPSTAECTLIQAQRPDVHLLLDFFQPTVSLHSSAGLQLKLSVRFSCFPTTVSVNLPFKIQVQNYYAFKGQRTLCLRLKKTDKYQRLEQPNCSNGNSSLNFHDFEAFTKM